MNRLIRCQGLVVLCVALWFSSALQVAAQESPGESVLSGVDLVGTLAKLKHSKKDSGDRILVKLNVSNVGTEIPASSFLVSLWLSTDALLDENDTLVAETEVISSAVEPGQATVVKLKKRELSAAEGMFVIVTIDDENSVVEDNEQNNQIVELVGRDGCQRHTLLIDAEPNDDPALSQALGKIQEDFCFTVRGNVVVAGDVDTFRLFVRNDQTIVATLTDTIDTDVNLELRDVGTGEVVRICADTTSPDVCTLEVLGAVANAPFDANIFSLGNAIGPYTLDLNSDPIADVVEPPPGEQPPATPGTPGTPGSPTDPGTGPGESSSVTGTYQGSGIVTLNSCQTVGLNGMFTEVSSFLSVLEQEDGTLTGTFAHSVTVGSGVYVEDGIVDGTVTLTGGVSGTWSSISALNGLVNAVSNGTFTGSVTGNTFVLESSGQDFDGDTCQSRGSFTLTR